jgi:hypothetical protein
MDFFQKTCEVTEKYNCGISNAHYLFWFEIILYATKNWLPFDYYIVRLIFYN